MGWSGLLRAVRSSLGPGVPRLDFTRPVLESLGPRAPLHRIEPSKSAFRAALKMIKCRAENLLVVHGADERAAGILTERDFVLKLSLEAGSMVESTVADLIAGDEDVATRVVAPVSYTMQECVNHMRSLGIRHMPIVDGEQVKHVLSMHSVSQQIR